MRKRVAWCCMILIRMGRGVVQLHNSWLARWTLLHVTCPSADQRSPCYPSRPRASRRFSRTSRISRLVHRIPHSSLFIAPFRRPHGLLAPSSVEFSAPSHIYALFYFLKSRTTSPQVTVMRHNWIRSKCSWLRTAATLMFTSTSLRVLAQVQTSAPFAYPDMPMTPYGPDWQPCESLQSICPLATTHHAAICPDYEVMDPLPNVTWTMPRSFAGSVSVNRDNHPNNTLFFYAFEREDGSLTAADGGRTDEPWVIWLNGGWVTSSEQTSVV